MWRRDARGGTTVIAPIKNHYMKGAFHMRFGYILALSLPVFFVLSACGEQAQHRSDAPRFEALRLSARYPEQISKLKELKAPIAIADLHPSKPNSAGGVDVVFAFSNISGRVIKYIDVDLVGINAVGDAVTSEVGQEKVYKGRITGPCPESDLRVVRTYDVGNSYWDEIDGGSYTMKNAIYNPSIVSVELLAITIIYMDGTTVKPVPGTLFIEKTDWVSHDVWAKQRVRSSVRT
jgi:hypothetical protein